MLSTNTDIDAQPGANLVWGACALGAALASAAVLFWMVRDAVFAGAFFLGLLGTAVVAALATRRRRAPTNESHVAAAPDITLLRAALDRAPGASAITRADGSMICANLAFTRWFGGAESPMALAGEGYDSSALMSVAHRDGVAACGPITLAGRTLSGEVTVVAGGEAMLLWSFDPLSPHDPVSEARAMFAGDIARRFGDAGVMAALADAKGRVVAANPAFAQRAGGRQDASLLDAPLASLIAADEDGRLHLIAEGNGSAPLRIVEVPLADSGLTIFMLIDDPSGGARLGEAASVHALLDSLPLGLGLVNIDGRFVHLNNLFRRAVGLPVDALPAYPGDLVIDEDKGPLSDAVRRFARGPAASSQLSLRLRVRPDDPVEVTIAGLRGLGDAAVMLSMRDNSEEDRLKRQIAQATKMQAVGQLAGGVAHDFNNILTAIIGHCDLMLMRHAPGDSDYDDIQQIRGNSNRAANLTRQLLAFSRQQTLRPQVLQLPDVLAEVSNLLKRLLGESISLKVKHGRNLGAVRADPGQLEQVIVNLAVNARDAMPDGGTLTIQTYSVQPSDMRTMSSKIMPIGEYTALRVSDTGSGIPDAILSKIFEPFFTTKEVGKGTGLGLSTVYGIVKQSGGFIFAEHAEGGGASFVIYLPVNRSQGGRAAPTRPKVNAEELWGSGTILLVEDEAMVRAVAERSLARHGYTMLTAESGEAALEMLEREGGVDLMISDVVMPLMDGPTTVREARRIQPELKVLFISGYAEEHLRKSIDLDNVAFLAKPFSVNALAEAVRNVLQPK